MTRPGMPGQRGARRLVDGRGGEKYKGGMKVKTSITLSEELLQAMSARAGDYKNRSDLIEKAVWTFLAQLTRQEQNDRDLEIINRHAARLNREAAEVLDYQVIP